MKKRRLLATALLTAAYLTACSNQAATVENYNADNAYSTESGNYLPDGDVLGASLPVDFDMDKGDFSASLNSALMLDDSVKIRRGDSLSCYYMIDPSIISKEDMDRIHKDNSEVLLNGPEYLSLLDEQSITSESKYNDGKIGMTTGTFLTFDFYLMPDSIANQISKSDMYCKLKYDIHSKLYVSDQGNIFYEIDEIVDFSEKDLGPHGDDDYSNTIEAKSVWQYVDGKLVLISFYQTGLGSNSENVINANFNYKNAVIEPFHGLCAIDSPIRRV